MSNKRRRSNEIEDNNGEFNQDKFLDEINKYPFLYRSLQAGEYVQNNPLELLGDNHEVYINEVEAYVKMIIYKFYSGSGIWIQDGNFSDIGKSYLRDDGLCLYINFAVPIIASSFNLNFSFFIFHLERTITDAFNKKNIKFIKFAIGGEGEVFDFSLHIDKECDITEDDGEFCNEGEYDLDPLQKGENDTYI